MFHVLTENGSRVEAMKTMMPGQTRQKETNTRAKDPSPSQIRALPTKVERLEAVVALLAARLEKVEQQLKSKKKTPEIVKKVDVELVRD